MLPQKLQTSKARGEERRPYTRHRDTRDWLKDWYVGSLLTEGKCYDKGFQRHSYVRNISSIG